MDNLVVIAVSMAVFMILLLTEHYISTVMLGASIVGLYMLGGNSLDYVRGALINEPMLQAASYTMTTVPLYIIMAQFITASGIIGDLYAIVYKASKGKKGPLGMLTVLMGGFLGAVSGSSMATAAALGQSAVPELRSRGYTKGLAGAVAASSGSLSAVIPPSMMLIVYGSVTSTSVTDLFMASAAPGILCMLVFMGVTLVFLNSKKEKALMEKETVEDLDLHVSRGRAIFVVADALLLVVLIFVGIYTGKFTPTEAGAIGAFLGFLTAVVTRTLNWKMLKECMLSTVKTACMTTFIMMAAAMFNRLITRSLMARYLMQTMEPLIERPKLLLFVLLAVYFVLFMFLDGSATVLMTVPILLPILNAANVDLIWFGCFVCLLCTLGGLTPPVGLNCYATAGASGLPLKEMFRYAIVFAIVGYIIVGGLMIMFPGFVLWLPSTM